MIKVKLSKQQKISDLEARCRERGLPMTVQRRAIFEALLDRHDHPTIDQVYEDIKARMAGVSRTTVYRTLETFVDLGVSKKPVMLQRWLVSTAMLIITTTWYVFGAIK